MLLSIITADRLICIVFSFRVQPLSPKRLLRHLLGRVGSGPRSVFSPNVRSKLLQ